MNHKFQSSLYGARTQSSGQIFNKVSMKQSIMRKYSRPQQQKSLKNVEYGFGNNKTVKNNSMIHKTHNNNNKMYGGIMRSKVKNSKPPKTPQSSKSVAHVKKTAINLNKKNKNLRRKKTIIPDYQMPPNKRISRSFSKDNFGLKKSANTKKNKLHQKIMNKSYKESKQKQMKRESSQKRYVELTNQSLRLKTETDRILLQANNKKQSSIKKPQIKNQTKGTDYYYNKSKKVLSRINSRNQKVKVALGRPITPLKTTLKTPQKTPFKRKQSVQQKQLKKKLMGIQRYNQQKRTQISYQTKGVKTQYSSPSQLMKESRPLDPKDIKQEIKSPFKDQSAKKITSQKIQSSKKSGIYSTPFNLKKINQNKNKKERYNTPLKSKYPNTMSQSLVGTFNLTQKFTKKQNNDELMNSLINRYQTPQNKQLLQNKRNNLLFKYKQQMNQENKKKTVALTNVNTPRMLRLKNQKRARTSQHSPTHKNKKASKTKNGKLAKNLQKEVQFQKETIKRIDQLKNIVENFANQWDEDYNKLDTEMKQVSKTIKHVKSVRPQDQNNSKLSVEIKRVVSQAIQRPKNKSVVSLLKKINTQKLFQKQKGFTDNSTDKQTKSTLESEQDLSHCSQVSIGLKNVSTLNFSKLQLQKNAKQIQKSASNSDLQKIKPMLQHRKQTSEHNCSDKLQKTIKIDNIINNYENTLQNYEIKKAKFQHQYANYNQSKQRTKDILKQYNQVINRYRTSNISTNCETQSTKPSLTVQKPVIQKTVIKKESLGNVQPVPIITKEKSILFSLSQKYKKQVEQKQKRYLLDSASGCQTTKNKRVKKMVTPKQIRVQTPKQIRNLSQNKLNAMEKQTQILMNKSLEIIQQNLMKFKKQNEKKYINKESTKDLKFDKIRSQAADSRQKTSILLNRSLDLMSADIIKKSQQNKEELKKKTFPILPTRNSKPHLKERKNKIEVVKLNIMSQNRSLDQIKISQKPDLSKYLKSNFLKQENTYKARKGIHNINKTPIRTFNLTSFNELKSKVNLNRSLDTIQKTLKKYQPQQNIQKENSPRPMKTEKSKKKFKTSYNYSNYRKQRISPEDDKFKEKFADKYFVHNLLKYCFYHNSRSSELQKNIQMGFFQVFQEIQQIKPVPLEQDKVIVLPPLRQGCKKTFLFDVDETLVHCNGTDSHKKSDVEFDVVLKDNKKGKIGFDIRPHIIETLKALRPYAEIITFTASNKKYADLILNHLDPNNELFDYRIYQDNCIRNKDKYDIKDLRILKNRNLKDVVLIDNAGYSFVNQLDNGIPIVPFKGNKNDTEFIELKDYLLKLTKVNDVRTINKKQFKLYKITQSSTVFKYLRDLFDFSK